MKINKFLLEYLNKLHNSILQSDINNLNKAALEIKKASKKKEQFLFVVMEDHLPYLIIMCVII